LPEVIALSAPLSARRHQIHLQDRSRSWEKVRCDCRNRFSVSVACRRIGLEVRLLRRLGAAVRVELVRGLRNQASVIRRFARNPMIGILLIGSSPELPERIRPALAFTNRLPRNQWLCVAKKLSSWLLPSNGTDALYCARVCTPPRYRKSAISLTNVRGRGVSNHHSGCRGF
jgi:hypothetical protein